MNTYQLEIFEPSALPILEDLERRKMISMRPNDAGKELKNLVERIRSKVKDRPPSLEEITQEVEDVRSNLFKRKNEN